ncbi:hypothetical protein PLICRDRAFT_41854 [Plicaturopsis crispa FD-325 SS-3]|nr:hypothetical protein PLICRDRAFT_41854 [Plicaturopsis crispa FD-325 SS-3]
MLMKNVILAYRYIVFAAFIVCNAIIASVAVWNLGIAQSDGINLGVDAFLVFVGASGLALIFFLIFVELGVREPITKRLWVECTWLSVYLAMEFAGAVAVSVMVPSIMCKPDVSLLLDGCTSTRVLMAFSWMCTIILLIYLVLLIEGALGIQHRYPNIWHTSVRDVEWNEGRQCLPSPPSSPTLPRFLKKAPSTHIVAPQPRRPAPATLYSHRNGLGSEYQIDHFSMPMPTIIDLPPLVAPPEHALHSSPPEPSLYPQSVQPALPTTASRSRRPLVVRNSTSSPPPLGDWPRENPFDKPARSRRKPPPAAFKFPAEAASAPAVDNSSVLSSTTPFAPPTTGSLPTPSLSTASPGSSPPRSKPFGPRTRSRTNSSGEMHRPPPLDLTRISALKGGGTHVT